MTRLGVLLLGGAGAVLAATVGLEATAGFDDGAPAARFVRAEPASSRLSNSPKQLAAEPGDETDARLETILARPLFSRDRRPGSKAATAVASVELPRLTGIIVGPDGKHAFFAPVAGGHASVVDEGGALGGYRVVSIAADGVRVEGPGAPSRVLTPAFGPAAASSHAEPPVPDGQTPAPSNGPANGAPNFPQGFPSRLRVPQQPPSGQSNGPQADGGGASQFERALSAAQQAGAADPDAATPP